MTLRHGQAVALMVAITAMWSIAGVVTRHLESARSFEITFWRSFFTVLSLLLILPLMQGRGVFRRVPWRSPYFWSSGLCWSVMFTAFMLALTLTSVANVLVTMAIGPLVTALMTRVALKHRLPPRTWGAIVLAGLGIGWMFGQQLQLGAPGFLAGAMVALCVPLAGGVQWTLVQKAQQQGLALDLVPSVMLGALISSALTIAPAWPMQASAHDIGLLALLGLVQLASPCALSVVVARVLKAPEVSLLALLEVVFGIALAWLGAGEAPQPSVLLGGSMVIAALVGNEWLGWRERARG